MVKDSRNNADSDISIDIEDGNYGSAVGTNYGTVNNNIYQTEK